MKQLKKIAMFMLAVCLVVPCFSFFSYAADGKIMFTDHTDPAIQTGNTVEVTGVVNKSNSTMGKIEITMTYDTSMLKFKSGAGITESAAGTITYSGDATRETGDRKEFKMTFEALKAGTATIQISSATVKNVSGTTMNYTKGSSTIKIVGDTVSGTVDPSQVSEGTVDVNGTLYHFSDVIPENEIPEGYVESTLNYDLVDYKVVYNENFNLTLAYLVGEDNVGEFFMYVEDDATFAPYEAIEISDKTTIVLLSNVSDVVLPKEYKATTVPSANGHEFPAWQTNDAPEYVILYAINSDGDKALYQFDSEEGTYQRFNAPEVVAEKIDKSFIGKLSKALENHLDYFILGAGFGFLLFVIIIVVLSVKLYNRNAELDEIYDEYGIENEDNSENIDLGMQAFVQEGMREVFPEEDLNEAETVEEEVSIGSVDHVVDTILEEATITKQLDVEEDTLGKALSQQMEEEQDEQFLTEQYQNEESEEDEEDDLLMEDFSVDFIDLDD